MTKGEMARRIDSVEEVMMELETNSELRPAVMRWLANLRDDINSFLRDYDKDGEFSE